MSPIRDEADLRSKIRDITISNMTAYSMCDPEEVTARILNAVKDHLTAQQAWNVPQSLLTESK